MLMMKIWIIISNKLIFNFFILEIREFGNFIVIENLPSETNIPKLKRDLRKLLDEAIIVQYANTQFHKCLTIQSKKGKRAIRDALNLLGFR